MKELEMLKEMYLDEIKKIHKKGELTPADGEAVSKALDALMKIDRLCYDNHGKESSMGYKYYSHPEHYHTYRMPSMSQYDDYIYEKRGRNSLGQYTSRYDKVQEMIDELENIRLMSPDEETRHAIDRCIDKLERR